LLTKKTQLNKNRAHEPGASAVNLRSESRKLGHLIFDERRGCVQFDKDRPAPQKSTLTQNLEFWAAAFPFVSMSRKRHTVRGGAIVREMPLCRAPGRFSVNGGSDPIEHSAQSRRNTTINRWASACSAAGVEPELYRRVVLDETVR
jgi:hypothetical protein